MYNVFEISQHVINYSIKEDISITNLKLQKILYYIQAGFLVELKKACFEEDIECWRHGPVVPAIYSKYKKYMDENINDIQEEHIEFYVNNNLQISYKKIKYDIRDFKKEDINLINKIIESYKGWDPWEMVNKTHEEEPWLSTEQNAIISIDRIRAYFIDNPKRIFGDI